MTNTQMFLACLVLLIIAIVLFLVTGSSGDAEYHCEQWWRCDE